MQDSPAPGKVIVTLLATAILTGCGSTPSPNYYLLTANAQPTTSIDQIDSSVGVGPVETAGFLQRPQIALHHGTNTLHVDDFNRWAEPVDEAMGRVIAQNVAALLNARRVVQFPWRRDEQPDLALRVTILGLDQAHGNAVLDVQWTLVDISANAVIHQARDRFQASSSADFKTLVGTFSNLIVELCERMASEIRNSRRN